jgi:hypothetical protein
MQICAWCYQTADETMITDHLDSRVHVDCAITAVGSGVERTNREYQQWLGMSGDEIV